MMTSSVSAAWFLNPCSWVLVTFLISSLGKLASSETDLLSTILHRMKSVEDHVTQNKTSSQNSPGFVCPILLSDITLPEEVLSGQFSRQIYSVKHLVKLLNGFLSHHIGFGSSAQQSRKWETLEPVARSAANVLLDAEPRFAGAHLCWFVENSQQSSQSMSPSLSELKEHNLLCHYFFRNSPSSGGGGTGSIISTGNKEDLTAATAAAAAGPAGETESIIENPQSLLPLLKQLWPQLVNVNVPLRERAGWTAPYFDCNSTWLITYLIGLSGRQDVNPGTRDHIVRGIFAIDILVKKDVDINQCSDDGHPPSPFAHTHKCKRETTMCQNISGGGFRKGSYHCVCKPGFYLAGPKKYFLGDDVEEAYSQKTAGTAMDYDSSFDCLPCAIECVTCVDDSPCVVTYDIVARGLPLGVLAFCITCSVFVGSAVYRYRKRKVIASATWPLLENIVVGAIMIYCSVIVRYFHPNFHLCLAEPWLREMGFMFFYCGVILKLYKVVTEFRTRKAHCVYVRDKDLVKYHVGIILITLGFMAAWTSVTVDLHRDGRELLLTIDAHQGLKQRICRLPWWDYVAEGCETLILLWGIYLSYLARNSKTLYMERKLLIAAICTELLISSCLYIIRHVIWYNVHPDVIYLLYFARSQLTVTVNMCVIFGGKLWYIFRPQDDPFRKNQAHGTQGRPAEMEKLHDGIFAGDLELNQIPLSDMDHGEIRMELRRLYAQMQVLKTKAMRKDNPHISKKKGGRKMPHRRFSIQAFSNRCRNPAKYDEETTAVKTPEESSVGSVENFHPDVPPTVYEEDATFNTPEHVPSGTGATAKNSILNRIGT